MQVTKQTKQQEEKPKDTNHRCMACGKYEVATFPVYLTEMDGHITQAGHVVRCQNCGYIKRYGLEAGIGRLNGTRMLKDFNRWPVLKRNGIGPDEWEQAVLDAARDKKRMVWVDARNGLLPADPDGTAAQIYKRWERLLNERSRLGFN